MRGGGEARQRRAGVRSTRALFPPTPNPSPAGSEKLSGRAFLPSPPRGGGDLTPGLAALGLPPLHLRGEGAARRVSAEWG